MYMYINNHQHQPFTYDIRPSLRCCFSAGCAKPQQRICASRCGHWPHHLGVSLRGAKPGPIGTRDRTMATGGYGWCAISGNSMFCRVWRFRSLFSFFLGDIFQICFRTYVRGFQRFCQNYVRNLGGHGSVSFEKSRSDFFQENSNLDL